MKIRDRFSALADRLQIPEEARGSTLVTVTGKQVLIENHRGILCFTPERIVLRTERGSIAVTGRELTICAAGAQCLCIAGQIKGLEREQ